MAHSQGPTGGEEQAKDPKGGEQQAKEPKDGEGPAEGPKGGEEQVEEPKGGKQQAKDPKGDEGQAKDPEGDEERATRWSITLHLSEGCSSLEQWGRTIMRFGTRYSDFPDYSDMIVDRQVLDNEEMEDFRNYCVAVRRPKRFGDVVNMDQAIAMGLIAWRPKSTLLMLMNETLPEELGTAGASTGAGPLKKPKVE